jgi:hypothetical protein
MRSLIAIDRALAMVRQGTPFPPLVGQYPDGTVVRILTGEPERRWYLAVVIVQHNGGARDSPKASRCAPPSTSYAP